MKYRLLSLLMALMFISTVLPVVAQDEVSTPEQQLSFIGACQQSNGQVVFSTTWLGDGDINRDFIYAEAGDDEVIRLTLSLTKGSYRRMISSSGSLQVETGKMFCVNPAEWLGAVAEMQAEAASQETSASGHADIPCPAEYAIMASAIRMSGGRNSEEQVVSATTAFLACVEMVDELPEGTPEVVSEDGECQGREVIFNDIQACISPESEAEVMGAVSVVMESPFLLTVLCGQADLLATCESFATNVEVIVNDARNNAGVKD